MRFLQYAPSGRIARELRGDTTFLAEVNSDTEEGAEDLDSAYIVIILFLSTGQTVSTEVSKIIVNCKIYSIDLLML